MNLKQTKGIQYFGMEMKEVEIKGEVIKIKGYASTPDIDRYNDIVEPKAFKSSIDQYMQNPIVLLQHDSDKPIGKVAEYKIGKKGLWIECEITNNLENVFQNITDGVLRTFSIGFIPKKWRYEEKDGMEVRVIEDLDLIENSVVTTPANGQALFTLSKSIKSFFDNLKDNQDNMEKKMTAEEVQDAPVVELEGEELIEAQEQAEASDEAKLEEGTNPEVLEEVESEGEDPSETETETTEAEVAAQDEVVEDEVNDQTKEEEKSFIDVKAMKQELKDVKGSISKLEESNVLLVEALEKSVNIITELKGVIAKIPMRKGLVSLGGEKEMSDLGKKLFQAKNNIS